MRINAHDGPMNAHKSAEGPRGVPNNEKRLHVDHSELAGKLFSRQNAIGESLQSASMPARQFTPHLLAAGAGSGAVCLTLSGLAANYEVVS